VLEPRDRIGSAATATTNCTGPVYRARYYDPVRSRFVNEDPIGFAGGSNFYLYAGGNPIILVDPLGLDWMETVSDFSAGFGDTLTLGGTRWIRNQWAEAFDWSDSTNRCSQGYKAGTYSAYAWETSMSVAATASLAGYEVFMMAYPRAGGVGINLVRWPWWTGALGMRMDRILGLDWHRFGPQMVSRPHIDSPPLGLRHWPWR
jgi:RHS repeat-associated protein